MRRAVRRYFVGYERHIEYQDDQMLLGSDCYALRCAYLHNGLDDITEQKARQVVADFQFIVTDAMVHRNKFDATLQLRVDLFCTELVDAVRVFLSDLDTRQDPDVVERLGRLLRMQGVEDIRM